MKITITGMPGAGKSTIAKALSEKLNLKIYSMGQIRRDIAKKKGITIHEFNKQGETDPSTDNEVDNYQKEIGQKEDNIIMEGRTSFFLVPDSIKLFVDVSLDEGAVRILKDLHDEEKGKKRNEGKIETIEEMKDMLAKRTDSDRRRYKKYYGVEDAFDKNQFDIIVDTTKLTIEEAIQETVNKIKEYTKTKKL